VNEGLLRINKFEGVKLDAYQDVAGCMTRRDEPPHQPWTSGWFNVISGFGQE
jgi:GH24 family phage-related lysozyme (muramidase)